VLEIAQFLVDIVRLLTLFLMLGLTFIMVAAGLYLASSEVRELVHDFEMWAAHRRLNRRLKQDPDPYPVLTEYAEEDNLVKVLLFEERQAFPTIFDQVVYDFDGDPRDPNYQGDKNADGKTE
jgi:hypothetical protein